MAYKRKYRKPRKYRKRTYRKKTATRRSVGVGRGIMGNKPMQLVIHKGLGFPGSFRTKLRYVDSFSLTSTTGALMAYYFNANGLYDPNGSGTGHQPMYFDRFMQTYNHYKVLGSMIQVRPTPTGTSDINPIFTTVISNDDNSIAGVSNFNHLLEWGMVNTYRTIGGSYPQGLKPIICKFSAKRTFKDIYDSRAIVGSVSANPTETSTFIIVQQPVDGVSTVSLTYEVIIDFIVDFFELKDSDQS